jgi:hypothetical protein
LVIGAAMKKTLGKIQGALRTQKKRRLQARRKTREKNA